MSRAAREISTIHPIHGNTLGIQPVLRKALERTFRRRVPPAQVVSVELAHHLAGISRQLNRQIGVLLTRDGDVREVMVGDASRLEIPEIGRLRGGRGRLRGLRLVHTHLKDEPLSEDDLNDLALLRLDMVAVIQARQDGLAGRIEVAHVLPLADFESAVEVAPFRRVTAPDPGRLELDFAATVQALEDEFAQLARQSGTRTGQERVVVVGAGADDETFYETVELARSAGVEVAGLIRQRRRAPHPRTAVGPGKLREIVLESMRRQADVAVFDIDLKPAQARAFEDATGLKAVDRTQLILDIFAQRARSRDGKLQVELAQLKYSLPRLTEKDAGLSRLTGGIGGRGPGETVLEIGRRRIFERIRSLEREVDRLSRQRDLRRQSRRRAGLPAISIIGYTNAGKSTLLNALTRARVETADQLFVTLDPTTRRLRFPRQGEVVLSDTVGFLKDLPPDLVNAFRATLEELESADLLLHVADASDPRLEAKVEAVCGILREMSLHSIPRLLVFNKCDLVPEETVSALVRRFDAVAVSAAQCTGLDRLVNAIERVLGSLTFGS
ncbi:MAG: GTPase HflX [Acidobacteriota bacterium]